MTYSIELQADITVKNYYQTKLTHAEMKEAVVELVEAAIGKDVEGVGDTTGKMPADVEDEGTFEFARPNTDYDGEDACVIYITEDEPEQF